MRLHDDHLCHVCGTPCLWCDRPPCRGAHCFNGHEHHGFDGRGQPMDAIGQ